MAYNCKTALVLLGLVALSACGGGSDGGGPASVPPPPPAPAPPPPPPPPPPPSGPLGQTQTFSTVNNLTRGITSGNGAAVQYGAPALGEPLVFSYSAGTNSYTISVPDFEPGTLVPDTSTSWDGDYHVAQGSDAARLQTLLVLLNPEHRDGSGITLTYTGYGTWGGSKDAAGGTQVSGGEFAYGIPTAANDVPVTGSASYTAQIYGRGIVSGWNGPIGIGGTAKLSFDFSNGTLSGYMDPTLMDDWGPTPLGRYTFVDTVHGVGSPTFSGRIAVPGSSDPSGFTGRFNGPNASELMASWFAPFMDPYSVAWRTASGVLVGKRD